MADQSTNYVTLLKKIAPGGSSVIISGIAPFLSQYCPNFSVNTSVRLSAFLAQIAHETAGFSSLVEYASGAAYQGRKDLGNIYPGDGIKFKGRGAIQVTGRTNYVAMSKAIFNDDHTLIDHPEMLAQPQYAILSALHYWDSHKLNALADSHDLVGIGKKVNGVNSKTGLPNGNASRLAYFAAASSAVSLIIQPLNVATTLVGGIAVSWLFKLFHF